MALVHDLAEAIVGDLTPNCGVSASEKSLCEQQAFDHIASILSFSHPEFSKESRKLWDEYEADESAEARLVKDIDKFELLLQLVEYEARYGKRMDDFWQNTVPKIRHETIHGWLHALEAQRK